MLELTLVQNGTEVNENSSGWNYFPLIQYDRLKFVTGLATWREKMGEELTFAERLLRLIGEEKPFSWAAKNDIAKSSIHNVLKFGRPPGPDQLVKISRATGMSIEWLLTGKDFSPQNKETCDDTSNILCSKLIWIPSILHDDDPTHTEQFPLSQEVLDWLRTNSEHLAFAYQLGDSMEPTISDGDLLIVDKETKQFTADGIYLILSDGVRMAKRLQKKMAGELDVQNDNPRYSPQTISLGAAVCEIRGKIVMVMHKL